MASQVISTLEEPDAGALLQSANLYLGQGGLDQAESAFQLVSSNSQGRHRADAFNGLGLVAMARGRSGYAMSLFRQALEAAPDHAEIRQNLINTQIIEGQRLVQEGRLVNAAAMLQATLDVMNGPEDSTGDDECRISLGRTFCHLGMQYRYQHGDFSRSIDALRKARTLVPESMDIWLHLDDALMVTGLPAEMSDYTNKVTKSEIGNHLLIACFPKSGSTFLKNVLVEVSEFPAQQLAYSHGKNDTGIYLPALVDCAGMDTVTQLHVRASDSNINLMQAFSIKPVILVRNIFDVLLSYKEHHDKFAKQMSFYDQYDSLDESQRLDLIVDDRAAWYIGFFAGWQRAVRAARIEGMWLTYEELMRDKVGKTEEILRFFGLDRPRQVIADAIEKVSGNKAANRFNKGVSGRGQSQFTDQHRAQIRRIAGYHPDINFSMIGL